MRFFVLLMMSLSPASRNRGRVMLCLVQRYF
ncbi:hypothetical protein IHE45_10G026300 [Dioscorea alata]|uniref:Uncharacterized protein n=1 Tax=Dioscorea alata TaxID=55571 RepID=A0ACB7V9Y3_DIOAL|nr:hypothetical protein IHE45_10G026300 [Dioscorea alata]